MTDIQFVSTPPSDGRRRHDHAAIVSALKARPGEWALILTGVDQSNATNIQTARLAAYAPAGSFEATARKSTDKCDIYARYVGSKAAK